MGKICNTTAVLSLHLNELKRNKTISSGPQSQTFQVLSTHVWLVATTQIA